MQASVLRGRFEGWRPIGGAPVTWPGCVIDSTRAKTVGVCGCAARGRVEMEIVLQGRGVAGDTVGPPPLPHPRYVPPRRH
jgi:hypothetical protein